MKTTICDICGEPISKKEERTAHLADRETSCGGVLERIAWDMDVHQECMEIGRKMDVRSVVLRAWKAAVRAEKDLRTDCHGPAALAMTERGREG